MPDQGIAQIIFPDSKDLETFLKEQGSYDLHEDLLKYGLTTKQFLYVDYKGEQYQEIVNFILDYEFAHQIELATQEELERLEAFNYEFLPDKIKMANKNTVTKGIWSVFISKFGRLLCIIHWENREYNKNPARRGVA